MDDKFVVFKLQCPNSPAKIGAVELAILYDPKFVLVSIMFHLLDAETVAIYFHTSLYNT